MDYAAEYQRRLTTPEDAVARIPHGATLVVGIAVSEPPALLGALAARARAGNVRDLRTYYMLAFQYAADTILAPDVAPFTRPYSLFEGGFDRALDHAAPAAEQPLLAYVPNYFSQIPRLLEEYIPVDVCLITVSPLDRSGYFTLGVSNDYGSTAARVCKQLIVE